MSSNDQLLAELLTRSAMTQTHLTSAITSFAFELIRSSDPTVRTSGSRMIVRLETINKELDQQWALITALGGAVRPELLVGVEEVQLQSA
ncbi:hypothetical protein AAA528_29885 [Pseudomonas aeruginosa]